MANPLCRYLPLLKGSGRWRWAATMAQPVITLYDVPSSTPQPWAPNIWRIRFILNYKRLRYRTQWVEFSDVEATLRSIGASPTSQRRDGRPVYTLPVIVDIPRPGSNPLVLSNANVIAEYLEVTYPARPIFPEGTRALQNLFVHYLQEVFVKPLLPILVPLTHQALPERSQAHFRGNTGPTTPPPTQLTAQQREHAWHVVKEQFDLLACLLDKNAPPDGNGIVVMGRDLSYADFALCSVLIWLERVSPHDGWARVRQWNNERWLRLYASCQQYMDVF